MLALLHRDAEGQKPKISLSANAREWNEARIDGPRPVHMYPSSENTVLRRGGASQARQKSGDSEEMSKL